VLPADPWPLLFPVFSLNCERFCDNINVLDALTYAGNRSTIADAPHAELVEGDIRDRRP